MVCCDYADPHGHWKRQSAGRSPFGWRCGIAMTQHVRWVVSASSAWRLPALDMAIAKYPHERLTLHNGGAGNSRAQP